MTEVEVIDVEEIENLPAVRASQAIIARDEISVDEIVAQREKIVQVMNAVMTEGVHYGRIPGVKNPSLFKPGAETINVALRLAPHYVSEKIWHDDGHLTVSVVCTLKHIPTGLEIATGEGLCTTKESRYAYRQGERVCPACGEPAIIKGKAEYGGGWVCFKKKGGCGEKYEDADSVITSQEIGKVPNPEIADTYNTVLKMADKRALVAAVLNGTAASDVFTQDVEDGSTASGNEPVPATRVDGPAPLRKPVTWAEIEALLGDYGDEGATYELFTRFGGSARKLLFADSDLTSENKMALFEIAAGAALALRNAVDTSKFPPPSEEDIAQAWASQLEGAALTPAPKKGE